MPPQHWIHRQTQSPAASERFETLEAQIGRPWLRCRYCHRSVRCPDVNVLVLDLKASHSCGPPDGLWC